MTKEIPVLTISSLENMRPVGGLRMGDYAVLQFGSGFILIDGKGEEDGRVLGVSDGLEAMLAMLLEKAGIPADDMPKKTGNGIRFNGND